MKKILLLISLLFVCSVSLARTVHSPDNITYISKTTDVIIFKTTSDNVKTPAHKLHCHVGTAVGNLNYSLTVLADNYEPQETAHKPENYLVSGDADLYFYGQESITDNRDVYFYFVFRSESIKFYTVKCVIE